LNAGDLRERVTIKRPVTGADEYGAGAPPIEATVATVWAGVRPLRANEILRAQQPGAETAYVVSMRYRNDVAADCWLEWNGRKLQITSVIDVGARRRELEILANDREAAASGA